MADGGEFLPVCQLLKGRQPVAWPCLWSPLPTAVSCLAGPVCSPVGLRAHSDSDNGANQSTLITRGSITCNISLTSPATVCLPGARASNVNNNLKVLESCTVKDGTQGHTATTFRNAAMSVPMI